MRLEAARSRHASVELCWSLYEGDSSIGGGLLAGALAYRLFVLLLPTSLLLVSGLGLYAGAADKSTRQVTKEAGLHGLFASNVAATASSGARWLVFILMIPAVLYAGAKLYRALAIVHAIVWHSTGRGARTTPRGVGVLLAVLLATVAATEIVSWIRRHDQLGGLFVLAVYTVVVGGAWLLLARQLPHGDARWTALVPGSLLFGVGLLGVNLFNVYVTARLVENRADTYGALGVATALLFSLVLVGRVAVISAELNAVLYRHRLHV
ncbi:MAG TPA: YhjD/YihY/BrkB family envelope integrity protein [Gaiellaceae bacterium]|nr:YhjD/YihY/BrkB family envelope integrity protein [Gaiellaceae bacterium]